MKLALIVFLSFSFVCSLQAGEGLMPGQMVSQVELEQQKEILKEKLRIAKLTKEGTELLILKKESQYLGNGIEPWQETVIENNLEKLRNNLQENKEKINLLEESLKKLVEPVEPAKLTPGSVLKKGHPALSSKLQLQAPAIDLSHEQQSRQAAPTILLLNLETELEQVKRDLESMREALGWRKESYRQANADCKKLRSNIATLPVSDPNLDQIRPEFFRQQRTCQDTNTGIVELENLIQELDQKREKLEEKIDIEKEKDEDSVSSPEPSPRPEAARAFVGHGQASAPEPAPTLKQTSTNRPAQAQASSNVQQPPKAPKQQKPSSSLLSSLPWKSAAIGAIVFGFVYYFIVQNKKASSFGSN